MIPILFKIGPFAIGSYGVMMFIAFVVCLVLLRKELQANKFDPEWAYQMIFSAALGGIVGARLYFIFEHIPGFLQDPLGMLFSRGGLTWYGGFILAFITVMWTMHKLPAPTLKLADLGAPLVLIGYAIGRIGCLLSGDGDYGPPSNLPWAMAFPHGLVPTNVPVHPTPAYETIMAGILFFILWRMRKKITVPGTMVGYMLVAYGIERFLSEFWRNTPKILFGWMTMAQIISILGVIGAIFWIRYLKTKHPLAVVKPLNK